MVIRSPLPQNYITHISFLEKFDTLSDWTPNTNTTLEVDNQYSLSQFGTSKGLKLTSPIGASGTASKTINLNVNNKLGYIYVWYYVHNTSITNIQYLTLRLGAGSNKFVAQIHPQVTGWNMAVIELSDWSNVGDDWSINRTLIRVEAIGGVEAAQITFAGIGYDIQSIPSVGIMFDDGDKSNVQTAFPYLQSKGIKATYYIIPSFVGTNNWMTVTDLQTLYNAGSCIGNHTYDHLDLSAMTKDQQKLELTKAKDMLDGWGFTRGSDHVAYPGGKHNFDTFTAIEELGYRTGRCTVGGYPTTCMPKYSNILCLNVDMTTNLSDISVFMEKCIRTGSTAWFLFHKVNDACTDETMVSNAVFQSVINLLCSYNPTWVTIDEWYHGLSNPRYREGLVRTKISRQSVTRS